MGKVLLFIAIMLFAWLGSTWYMVVQLGIVHSWWAFVPTIGVHKAAVMTGVFILFFTVAKVVGTISGELMKD